MKTQLPFFQKGKIQNNTILSKSSARLTNSVNKTAYNSFNKWGGLTFEDILSNYPKETIDKCWLLLSQSIIENYCRGKGTFIKNFGTFTLTNVEYNLEGTTNEYTRDIKRRRPVFIVSNDYIDYIKPGIYTEKSGMIYYTQKINKNVSIVKLNFAKLSYGGNISKEEISTIIYSIIKNMSDKIRRREFKEKNLPGVGTFLIKGNVFGMKFDTNLFDDISLKTQKLFHIKKNFKFYMETKDSQGVQHRNITDIDKAEREIRPNIAVLTKITPSADNWLQENMGIDVKKDVLDEPREDLFFLKDKKNLSFTKNKNDFLVDQRYYRSYPIQNLYGLKIPQNILESIYKSKSLLMRGMKQIDRHGDGLIPKYDFINTFYKINCHHLLRIELIEEITNVYLNNDPKIIMVQYKNLINTICDDIKNIIDNEYNLFPIEKYKYSISPDNKRAVSQNMFSRDTGNLNPKAISSLQKYNKLPKINESDIRKELERIGKISIFLGHNYKINKMVSYLELLSILEKYKINLNKPLIVQLLKFLDINNPNCFYLKDFVDKVNMKLMNSTCYNFRKNNNKNNILNNSANANSLINDQPASQYATLTEWNSPQNSKRRFNFKKNNTNLNNNLLTINSKKNNSPIENSFNVNEAKFTSNSTKNLNNNMESKLLNIKLIKIIKDKIFQKSSKIDNISEYFDHLLSYNICRRENVIYPDELERLFQLEQYSFTIPEINSIFYFIDTKKDGFIDRIEFIDSIRNVPHPISSFINYMKNKGLTIADIAYKMDFDLYNRALSECLNTKLDKLSFQVKMKLVNDSYDNEFLSGLFHSLTNGKNEIYIEKVFDIFNYNNDNSYRHLSEIKNEVINKCHEVIPKCVSYTELKNNFLPYDKQVLGLIHLDNFLSVMKKYLGSKISSEYLLHFLRINKFINNKNMVNYREFLMNIYIECRDDTWVKCLNAFRHFLKKECNDDLFIFIVKINNLCNNISIKRTVEIDRMHRFLKGRIGTDLDLKTVNKFDYNKDGIISMDDLKNIILIYLDKHFFENQKTMSENSKLNELKVTKNENKKLFLTLKDILNKHNMTEENLFSFLDNNKDNLVDYDEFKIQLPKLLKFSNNKFTSDNIEKFFNYLDEYKTKKIDINIFRNKYDEIVKNHENGYKGNSTIENLILTEFSKWFKRNINLSDTELFPILDHDHDGIVSINDIKYFANNVLHMPLNELSDTKILHFIIAISLTNSNNLVLADIQHVMQNIKKDKTDMYLNNIHNYCNEGIDETNKDKEWIDDVISKIGLFINETYDNDIKQFYDDYNLTNFRNQGQGLSFDNFVNFLDRNHQLLEQYHIYQEQQLILFNYISSNKKYITLQMLQKLFGKNNDTNNYNFYLKMHKDIIKFLHENYPKCEDAFKFFHKVKTQLQETPTYNDYLSKNTYITKKEFFDGINKIFPNKYKTNTVLNYYQKIFRKKLNLNKKNENQKQDNEYTNIKFSEFNYVYYSSFEFDNYFTKTLKQDSKILTTRKNIKGIPFTTFNSPFEVKEHEKFETPYDLDPLEKIKRLILSSKMDFKKEFKEIIKESSNGMANQFEFRNIIKRLDIGLTNIEIEDIVHKSGMSSDGKINLIDFYKYIIDENKNLVISKKHVLEQLKEIKQLIYKYYSNPRLAFELNDIDVLGKIDFDKFKKIIYDLYKREIRQLPSYAVLKYVYDYIDIRKDGIIDLNEWNKIFAEAEGKLDISANEVIPSQMKILRQWETSNDIIEIYKIIAKNRKIIKDKVKLFTVEPNTMLIKANDMIYVLKDVLNKIKLSQTQWKMIVSIGDKDKSGIIDFNTFISVVDTTAKMGISHPVV